MKTSDFYYNLPEELIAQTPIEPRNASRLMLLDKKTGEIKATGHEAKEMLGMRFCVLHNLYFYNKMMEEIRQALDEGRYAEYKKAKLAGFEENNKE